MLNELSEKEVKLLTIISRLVFTNRQANAHRINFAAGIKIPDLLNCWEEPLEALIDKGVLKCTTTDDNVIIYEITEYGKSFAQYVNRNNYIDFFFYNEFFKKAEQSKAHAEFCRLVYGENLCQHGMLDINQLHKLIEISRTNMHSHVLELGCGNGLITEYISDITQSHIIGIDIASEAIERANHRTIEKRGRIVFETKSMENLDYPDNSFDAVISIDTLYFTKNLESTVQSMIRVLKTQGIMYVFYHVPPEVGNAPGSDPARCSRLGKVLDKLDLKYKTIDFTKENNVHWRLKKQVLLELRPKFEEEGNLFLYNNRMEECMGTLGDYYRFLFMIKKDDKNSL